MPIALLWLQLAGVTVIIVTASHFLAKSADIISYKTGLGQSLIGVVLLATATSLPELGTGVSSVTFFDAPDLAAGDAFGSNLLNLMIIGLLDLISRKDPILTMVNPTAILVGALGIGLIAIAVSGIVIHDITTTTSTWPISPVSVVLIMAFAFAVFMIYRFEQAQDDTEIGANLEYDQASATGATVMFLASAGVILGSAIWLAQTGDNIAEEMGWEASFVGTQFLALSTSLPELATAVAALRLNAPTLAISNVLGSNLFNMGFVLFVDDAAFTDGVLWSNISQIHILTAIIAIIMTTVVIVSLIDRYRTRPSKFWTFEAVVLIGLYVVASILVFKLG
ncbi:MAG: sodium:calcium antiporter [SAR202 cluster bacterium]|jgi:cation:H+ antiporter|nr:sodium:calcium antiporter [SAR202 cluster bacterium]MDP6514812.1 sodium:calcium antiporter [SAR202 cluster bacterium]MDP6714865.1 sodium:calcium antiporter [SAR202 cluster bacterium]